MKTAISIPDHLFAAAEARATQLGVTRSHLYARALERLLADDPDVEITFRLDAVYATEDSVVDEALIRVQQW
jgi:hypothetical protein